MCLTEDSETTIYYYATLLIWLLWEVFTISLRPRICTYSESDDDVQTVTQVRRF